MASYDRYSDIDNPDDRKAVGDAIVRIHKYCLDIVSKLHKNFTVTVEGKSIMFFDIRHSNPHYYIEIIKESGIVNVRGYGQPTIKIIGGG